MDTVRGFGAVICHRWFAAGAGWAFHPAVAAAGVEPAQHAGLAAALDLDRERTHEVSCPAPGGVFWGEYGPDPNCPDPKAARRKATILRVAHLPAAPDPAQREAVLAALRALVPTDPGPDARLVLPAAARGAAASPARPWVAAAGGVVLALAAAGAWLATRGDPPSPTFEPDVPSSTATGTPSGAVVEPRPAPVPAAAPGLVEKYAARVRASKALDEWYGVEKAAEFKTDAQVLDHFFDALTAPELTKPAPSPKHPDYAFLDQFQTGKVEHGKPWDEARLAAVIKALKDRDLPVDDANLRSVVEKTDYVSWLEGKGRDKLKGVIKEQKVVVFPFDAAPEEAVRRFARRLRKAAPDQKDVTLARACIPLYKQWGINGVDAEDAARRPELVLRILPAVFSPHRFKKPDGKWASEIEDTKEQRFLDEAFNLSEVHRIVDKAAKENAAPGSTAQAIFDMAFSKPAPGGRLLDTALLKRDAIRVWRSDQERPTSNAAFRDYVERLRGEHVLPPPADKP